MGRSPLDLEIRRIVTDSDLDGVVTAAILLRWWKNAEVVFAHPGELRAGLFDDKIDRWTAICDLPSHPNCGLCIDHHQSNKPEESAESPVIIWRESPSAARIAYDLLSEQINLSDLDDLLFWVDKLDSGGITSDEYLSQFPALILSWAIDSGEEIARKIMNYLEGGAGVERILSEPEISSIVNEMKIRKSALKKAITERIRIVDRLAIVRLDGLGMRSNGYQVTAMAGDECDACVVIHGDIGDSFGEPGGSPVSASFYTNSFLHSNGGVFDLTLLAKCFDRDGGGHANACGCRIKPLGEIGVENREVIEEDVERNISAWLKMWSDGRSENIQQI